MNFNEQYMVLAAKLGDIQYKLTLLKIEQEKTIEEIKQLDKLAGLVNAQKDETAQGNNAGNNSPA